MTMVLSTVKQTPQPLRVVQYLKKVIESTNTFLKADSVLILACGRQPNPQSPGGRDRILDYAKKHLKTFQFFIAENIFGLQGGKDIDLLTLEEHLSSFCDCVLVVLESESAFAELGAFAIKKELVKIMLVINDISYKENNSFISLGPLAKINKKSKFKPVINVDLKSILRAVPELNARLLKIKRKNKKHFDISDAEGFSKVPSKVRMLFLLDMITFFQPISHAEIINILKAYYGNREFEIDVELNLLTALGLAIMEKGEDCKYFMRPVNNQDLSFVYIGLNERAVRANVINHYHKYARYRVALLRRKVGELL
jgi:hypothetical protein